MQDMLNASLPDTTSPKTVRPCPVNIAWRAGNQYLLRLKRPSMALLRSFNTAHSRLEPGRELKIRHKGVGPLAEPLAHGVRVVNRVPVFQEREIGVCLYANTRASLGTPRLILLAGRLWRLERMPKRNIA